MSGSQQRPIRESCPSAFGILFIAPTTPSAAHSNCRHFPRRHGSIDSVAWHSPFWHGGTHGVSLSHGAHVFRHLSSGANAQTPLETCPGSGCCLCAISPRGHAISHTCVFCCNPSLAIMMCESSCCHIVLATCPMLWRDVCEGTLSHSLSSLRCSAVHLSLGGMS